MKRRLHALTCALFLALTTIGQNAAPASADLEIGSDSSGSGSLKVAFDFTRNVVALQYTGFSTLFEATDPGFAPAETEAPSIYELLLNTEVLLEVLYLSPGVSLELRSVPITAPGSYVIGTHDQTGANFSASDLHQHPAFRILLSTPPTTYFAEGWVMFRLIEGSSTNGYTASPPYALKVSNGFLGELDYGTGPAIDSGSQRCQQAVGRTVSQYFSRVTRELRRCFDRVIECQARQEAGHPSAPAACSRAEKACADQSGSGPDSRTLLGRLAALELKAVSDLQIKCGQPGDTTLDGRTIPPNASSDYTVPEQLRAHLGMVRCQAEHALGAAYPGILHQIETFSARPSQGGDPLPNYFPCLAAIAEGHGH